MTNEQRLTLALSALDEAIVYIEAIADADSPTLAHLIQQYNELSEAA